MKKQPLYSSYRTRARIQTIKSEIEENVNDEDLKNILKQMLALIQDNIIKKIN